MKHLLCFLALCFSFVLSAEVPQSAEAITPVDVGATAPNPTLRNLDGDEVSLTSVLGGEPTVLVFYRGGWCPYCTRHLSALQEALPGIREAGWNLVALSPDTPEHLAETVDGEKLSYDLYSDSTLEAAKDFGLAFQVDAPTVAKLEGYGIDLVAASGEEHRQLPVPAVILIDADSTVRFLHQEANYKKRLSAKKLLKAIAEIDG